MDVVGMLGPRERVEVAESTGDPDADALAMSTVRLALVLRSRPDVYLRAAYEGWDIPRIVRELY